MRVCEMAKWIKSKELKASFTVEASYIIPIVIIILLLVMSFTIYLHDIFVTEVDGAHIVEEGRMGLSYGRIPYSTQIYQEEFDDSEEMDDLIDYMSLYFGLYSSAAMQGTIKIKDLDVTEKGVEACLKYESSILGILKSESESPVKKVNQERRVYYPCVYAGVTKLVYQMGKIIM